MSQHNELKNVDAINHMVRQSIKHVQTKGKVGVVLVWC